MFAKKNMAGELMLPEVKPADRFASAQRNRSWSQQSAGLWHKPSGLVARQGVLVDLGQV
jgi:hypothetical protein